MNRKQRRLYFALSGLGALAVAAALILSAFQDSLVFFYSPSDIVAKQVQPDQRLRLGGLVLPGSVSKQGATTKFAVTDGAQSIDVVYTGLLPDLFREGQGVVTEGRLGADRVFMAATVLAKHDENYMPPEVADALKRAGHWQPGGKP